MSISTMPMTVLVTGAASGFGALTGRVLADAGHIVYAGMSRAGDRNGPAVTAARAYAKENGVQLRVIELDVADQGEVDAAVETVTARTGAIDVVVHNTGRMVLGPAEAFTPEQLARIYDANVLAAQRVNRAVLPQMRRRRDGLLVWVSSPGVYGATPPYLGPYFGAMAAVDHLAACYATELARFGIGTTVVVPGSFSSGSACLGPAMRPADTTIEREYEGPYAGLLEQVGCRLAGLAPPGADAVEVAHAIATVVDTPKGKRPFRVTVDPAHGGSRTVSDLADRVRADFYARIGLTDLLTVDP